MGLISSVVRSTRGSLHTSIEVLSSLSPVSSLRRAMAAACTLVVDPSFFPVSICRDVTIVFAWSRINLTALIAHRVRFRTEGGLGY